MPDTPTLGRYRLLKRLAVGGMAELFLARIDGPMGFEKTLVLKRILPHLVTDERFVEMFLGEAKLAAQLNHPNLVQIFDFGEADDVYFIAMEYVDGLNLRQIGRRLAGSGETFPTALGAKVIAQVCEGLAYAHEFRDPQTGAPVGLIHRDVSPENIIIGKNGTVKLVDFGIAKSIGQEHKTQTGLLKGKLAYMAPEQIKAEPIDHRVDVYSLGVVLYELVTGLRPFDSESEVGLMNAVLYDPPTPLASSLVNAPKPLQAIITKVLEKNRDRRYQSCEALQADLDAYIHGSGERPSQHGLAQLMTKLWALPANDKRVPSRPGKTPVSKPGPPSVPWTEPKLEPVVVRSDASGQGLDGLPSTTLHDEELPPEPPMPSVRVTTSETLPSMEGTISMEPLVPVEATSAPTSSTAQTMLVTPLRPSRPDPRSARAPAPAPAGAPPSEVEIELASEPELEPVSEPELEPVSEPELELVSEPELELVSESLVVSAPALMSVQELYPVSDGELEHVPDDEAEPEAPALRRRPQTQRVPRALIIGSFAVAGLAVATAGLYLGLKLREDEPTSDPTLATPLPDIPELPKTLTAVPDDVPAPTPTTLAPPPDAPTATVEEHTDASAVGGTATRTPAPQPLQPPDAAIAIAARPPGAPAHPEASPPRLPRAPPPTTEPTVGHSADLAGDSKSTATLIVTSSPKLQVKIGGTAVGRTPVTATVPAGEVEVVVGDDSGQVSRRALIRLSKGETLKHHVEIGQGVLEFDVPPATTVIMDGKTLGKAPLRAAQVFEGLHQVRFVNDELKRDVSTEVRVGNGDYHVLKADFDKP